MLPDFGCGLLTLVFEPNSELLAAATELLVRSSLQRWLRRRHRRAQRHGRGNDDASLVVDRSTCGSSTDRLVTEQIAAPGAGRMSDRAARPLLHRRGRAPRRVAHADDVQAIDYLEVDGRASSCSSIHFIAQGHRGRQPAAARLLDDLAAHPAQVRITGGERVAHIRVEHVAARRADPARPRRPQAGDFSTYTLTLDAIARDRPGLRRAWRSRSRPAARRASTAPAACECEEIARRRPQIDYLAKDYRSFRQALLDRLPTRRPGLDGTPRGRSRHGAARVARVRRRPAVVSTGRGRERGVPRAPPASGSRCGAMRGWSTTQVDEGASARAFVVATVSSPLCCPRRSSCSPVATSPSRGTSRRSTPCSSRCRPSRSIACAPTRRRFSRRSRTRTCIRA